MGHTCLVAHNRRQVDGLLGVILFQCPQYRFLLQFSYHTTHLGEGLDLSAMARSTLAGQETKGAVAGGFVLQAERHHPQH
jgi:hypothetical protein